MSVRGGDGFGVIDSTELRMMHALACTGSFTAAAARLQLSQPAVSQRIKRLERRLAVTLIERQGRGIRLTKAGEILAEHARAVVADIDAALAAIDQLRGTHGGTLRLVGFPSASATIVPALMRQLAVEAPQVTLKYLEAEPPEAIALLRDGGVDCALVFDYEGADSVGADCTFVPLWRETVSLVASEDRAVGVESAHLADYATAQWIAGCEKCRGHLLAAAAEHGFTPEITQETDNVPAMLAMAAAGGAVALVPGLALAAARILPDRAVALPLEPARYRTIGLVILPDTAASVPVSLCARLLARVDGGQWNLRRCA